MNRRQFLSGVSAVAAAAALPAGMALPIDPRAANLALIEPLLHAPIFPMSFELYCGVIIREVEAITGISDIAIGSRAIPLEAFYGSA